ncbi:MAG: hypothetical protein ACYTGG_06380, partial [Planctomycetota bacterium]
MDAETRPPFGQAETRPPWPPGPDDPATSPPVFVAPDEPLASGPRPPRGFAGLAWIVIILAACAAIFLPKLQAEPAQVRRQQDAVGLTLMRLQGRYIVGVTDLGLLEGSMAYEQIRQSLNVGSPGQRQRVVVLAAELAGPAAAGQAFEELDLLIEQEQIRATPPFELTPDEAAVQGVLGKLYPVIDEDDEAAAAALPGRVADLTADERAILDDQLDWFGQLALLPPGTTNVADREDVLAPTRRTALAMVGGFMVLAIGGLGGFAGLIL